VSWDVVVVGAGPAGSAVSARLAGAGWRVLLVDRARFPRRKPCGECLNPGAVGALARLGVLERVMALEPSALRGWRIEGEGGRGFVGRFPPGAGGLAMPRAALDALLLAHARGAGAVVRTGVRVTGVVRERGRVSGVVAGEETIPARVVVGADGLRSVVVRRLDLLRRPPRLRKVALTAHLRGVELPAELGVMRVRGARCVGAVAVGGGLANVVLVLPTGEAASLEGDPGGFLDAELRRWGIEGERVDDALTTGPFDFPVRRRAVPGAVLVGDAAGYYDPFTGEGVYRAVRGAELAAAAIDRELRGEGGRAVRARYLRAHRLAFGPGEALQHGIEAVVGRPRLLRPALSALSWRPLGDAIVRLAGDVHAAHPVRGSAVGPPRC
jgi:menaquinone-9 beta-reductase